MTLKQAFFILRHGSAEGNHKYLEAVKVIEDEYNRQKEELDLAKKAIIALTEERMKLQREIDNECDHCGCVLIDQRDNARADAVKEFAERLKEKSRYPMGTIYVEHIDDLVKEFTEGNSDGEPMQT